jgi:SNF family Na+-dependent transporter
LVLFTVLLVRSVTLDGAWTGIKYLFTPDLTKLYSSKVWIEAVTQVFYSYGLGYGSIIALGSYNNRKNNCY